MFLNVEEESTIGTNNDATGLNLPLLVLMVEEEDGESRNTADSRLWKRQANTAAYEACRKEPILMTSLF